MRAWVYHLFKFLILISMLANYAQGGVVYEGPFFSHVFKTNRTIRIYLPSSYNSSKRKRYPVLYAHDGQNAFSTVGPYVAFGWGNWELDKTSDRLAREGKMREIIIVAVDCSRQRYREYRGPTSTNDNSAYENYKRFLIDELKPKIDHDYRTQPGPKTTGLIGSSMGGICSLALAWERPDIFGQAASLSGAFQVEGRYFLRKVLREHNGKPKKFRIYLDSGTVDYTGGDDGLEYTTAVANELQRIGWKPLKDIEHFVDKPLSAEQLSPLHLANDKFKEAQNSQHNELYWRLRAWRPLVFMFPPG